LTERRIFPRLAQYAGESGAVFVPRNALEA
jgi:hypothetical protein